MRPVTLFTIQWGDLPLEEMCRQAQEMGYEGLELSASHLDMKRAASDPEYVKEVKDTLKKYGLGCWAISNHLAGQCVVDSIGWMGNPISVRKRDMLLSGVPVSAGTCTMKNS